MQCKKCKAEWTPPKGASITKCLFCSEPIIKATSVNKEIELHDLLLEIVNQYEKNILGEMRLYALLSDLMPNIEKHHKSIIKQVLQDKVGDKLLQLEQESEATRVIKIDAIKDSFKTNNAYNETADYIVDCFLFSLGWLSNIDKQQYKPKATTDAEVVFHQQIDLEHKLSELIRNFTRDNVLNNEEEKIIKKTLESSGFTKKEIKDVFGKLKKELKFTIGDKPLQQETTTLSTRKPKPVRKKKVVKIDTTVEAVEVEDITDRFNRKFPGFLIISGLITVLTMLFLFKSYQFSTYSVIGLALSLTLIGGGTFALIIYDIFDEYELEGLIYVGLIVGGIILFFSSFTIFSLVGSFFISYLAYKNLFKLFPFSILLIPVVLIVSFLFFIVVYLNYNDLIVP